MSDTMFDPNAAAMQYPRVFDDLSDMMLLPFDQQSFDLGPRQVPPPQQSYPMDSDYTVASIQNLQLQLYQELRNQVMWQDLRTDASFNSSLPEYETNSADSSTDTPPFDQSMSSMFEPQPMYNVSMEMPLQPHVEALPETEYTTKPKAKAKGKSKKHKRRHVMPRSKKGCWICRIKHLKCDEKRPHCEACRRFGIACDFSDERPAYVMNSELRKQKLVEITRKRRVKSEF